MPRPKPPRWGRRWLLFVINLAFVGTPLWAQASNPAKSSQRYDGAHKPTEKVKKASSRATPESRPASEPRSQRPRQASRSRSRRRRDKHVEVAGEIAFACCATLVGARNAQTRPASPPPPKWDDYVPPVSARSGAEPNATARPASNVPSSAAYDDIEEPGEAGAPSSFPKRQARVSIRDAASRAASGCMLPRPVQPLTVTLTFSPKGDVTKVVIPPGFIAGTEECLKEYFGGIEVRPFDGEPIEVHRTVFRNR